MLSREQPALSPAPQGAGEPGGLVRTLGMVQCGAGARGET